MALRVLRLPALFLLLAAVANPIPLPADTLRFVTGGLSPGPPASDADRIYLVSEDRYLYAFDYDGLRLWRRDIGRLPLGPAVLAPDGSVLVSRQARGVSAYNRRGVHLWSSDIPDITGSPTVSPRGLIIVPRSQGWISVLSPTGRLLNAFRIDGEIHRPAVLTSEGYLAVSNAAGGVSAVDGAGNPRWRRSFSGPPTVVAADLHGGVLLGFDDGRILSLGPEGDVLATLRAPGGVSELRATREFLAAVTGRGGLWVFNRSTGDAWEASPPGEELSGVVPAEEHLAAVSASGALYLFSQEGRLLRELRLPEGAGLSDPVVPAGGGLAAVGTNWVVYLFRTDTAGCPGPWGCPRGGPSLAGGSGLPGARDLVLPAGGGNRSLERIYFEELLSSPIPEERAEGMASLRQRLEAGNLGGLRTHVVPLLRANALDSGRRRIAPEERIRFIELLADLGTYEAAGALAGMSGNVDDPQLLVALARALGRLRSDPDGRSAAALAAILARSSAPEVAGAVVSALDSLVRYAGEVYAPAVESVIRTIAEGNHPLPLKRRALSIGSLESSVP